MALAGARRAEAAVLGRGECRVAGGRLAHLATAADGGKLRAQMAATEAHPVHRHRLAVGGTRAAHEAGRERIFPAVNSVHRRMSTLAAAETLGWANTNGGPL